MAKRGPKSSVTVIVGSQELKLSSGKIKQFLRSSVRPFSSSGAYIPIPQEFSQHDVFVIIMEK